MVTLKRILRDIIITASISVVAFIFVLPNVVTYVLNHRDIIDKSIKENIALAALKYFNQESSKDLVSIEELTKKGYITDQDYLKSKNCNSKISNVYVEKVNTNKSNYYVSLYCNNNISKLTLSN